MLGKRLAGTVNKTPFARLDLNDYTVPYTQVRRTLTVLADDQWARIVKCTVKLARHARCWDRARQIEDHADVQRLVDYKRAARARRACDRLA